MKTKLKKLNVAETELEKAVQNWLNDKASDYDDNLMGVLNDLLQHGCISGMVGSLVYYRDTNDFYDRHQEDIDQLVYDMAEEMGYKNIYEFIASLNGAENVGGEEQHKNLLTWFAFEETARNLGVKAGLDI